MPDFCRDSNIRRRRLNFKILKDGNKDIFLADGDALVCLAEPMCKKYFTAFVWGHPFSTNVSHDRFFKPYYHFYAYIRI